ncbi:hypothetical protein [Singulisphaera sp. PoT]|uniref:hypothetical protein n=1 Tax=Singulisphaera sp. PoT TaxID=3411797 RepID=UPI003BF4948D
MGSDFNSTTELRICRLEDAVNALSLKLSQVARDISALQQSFMQMAGSFGSQNGGAATGARPARTGSGGISAASGVTPGSGTVTLYRIDRSTGNLTSLGTATCYSWFTTVTGSGAKNIMVTRDPEGNYWVFSEDC